MKLKELKTQLVNALNNKLNEINENNKSNTLLKLKENILFTPSIYYTKEVKKFLFDFTDDIINTNKENLENNYIPNENTEVIISIYKDVKNFSNTFYSFDHKSRDVINSDYKNLTEALISKLAYLKNKNTFIKVVFSDTFITQEILNLINIDLSGDFNFALENKVINMNDLIEFLNTEATLLLFYGFYLENMEIF